MSVSLSHMLPFLMPRRVDYLFRIPTAEKPFSFVKYLFELLEWKISHQVGLACRENPAYLVEKIRGAAYKSV
jgi:hypothetical protein